MRAEELRIGNLVYCFDKQDSEVKTVSNYELWLEILDPDEDQSYSIETEIDNIEPIPLTEEWLLKFGFKYSKEEIEYFIRHYYTLNDIEVKIEQWKNNMEFDKSYSLYKDYGYITSINYVHQLQNLYFALTGEELKLNN